MTLDHVAIGDPHVANHNAERDAINALEEAQALLAPLADPVFTGDPKAPTPATADNDTSIATTAFVKAQGYASLASPTFTGDPKAPTPATADNDTSIATTAFVKAQGYAPLADAALTGTPTAPTPAAATNTTQIATTAFVKQQGYVDLGTLYNLQVKPYVTVVSVTNVALSGLQNIDGVTLVAGSRVLLVSQTNAAENGIWTASAGAWTRPSDFDSATESNGAVVSVAFGAVYTGTRWTTKGVGGGVFGTAAQMWYRVLDTSHVGTGQGQLAVLNASGRFDIARLASGTPDGTKFVRDDGTLAIPAGGGSVSAASETVAGIAELATQAEASAGTDDARIVTPLKMVTYFSSVAEPVARGVNNQTGTAYTLVLTDRNKIVTMSNVSNSTLTVPPNSSVAFPIGTYIEIMNQNTGDVTITPGSGVTLRSPAGLKMTDQYSTAGLRKIGTDEWQVMGRTSV